MCHRIVADASQFMTLAVIPAKAGISGGGAEAPCIALAIPWHYPAFAFRPRARRRSSAQLQTLAR